MSLELLQAFGELIWAGSSIAALNTVKPVNGLINLHADEECPDTFRVAWAAADEFDFLNRIALVSDADEPRTDALRLELECLRHYS